MVYYNEFDKGKAAWLRELIKAGAIANGYVDERSIVEVTNNDLNGFLQWHFFAGIGIWSYALRLAGFPDDRECLTASCPCQPFSQAGKSKGFEDRRHLWPECFRIIKERRPVVVFGEQVQSPDGLTWLDLVSTDLEGIAYTPGATGLCGASIGAPHARNRLFFVADTSKTGLPNGNGTRVRSTRQCNAKSERSGDSGELADSASAGLERATGPRIQRRSKRPSTSGVAGVMGHSNEAGRERRVISRDSADERAIGPSGVVSGMDNSASGGLDGRRIGSGSTEIGAGDYAAIGSIGGATTEEPGPVNGFWRNAQWILCRPERPGEAGRYRPVEPAPLGMDDGIAADLGRVRLSGCGGDEVGESGSEGIEVFFPLIQKGKARTLRLHGYGDGIVAQVAAEFIKAYMQEWGIF